MTAARALQRILLSNEGSGEKGQWNQVEQTCLHCCHLRHSPAYHLPTVPGYFRWISHCPYLGTLACEVGKNFSGPLDITGETRIVDFEKVRSMKKQQQLFRGGGLLERNDLICISHRGDEVNTSSSDYACAYPNLHSTTVHKKSVSC